MQKKPAAPAAEPKPEPAGQVCCTLDAGSASLDWKSPNAGEKRTSSCSELLFAWMSWQHRSTLSVPVKLGPSCRTFLQIWQLSLRWVMPRCSQRLPRLRPRPPPRPPHPQQRRPHPLHRRPLRRLRPLRLPLRRLPRQ